jgi:predicted DNA-binding transcriptional regulator YafY
VPQPPSAQRLSRLLNLYALLTETNRPLTAREIREQLDADYGPTDAAFRRGFERDKEELRALGIELRVEEVVAASEVPEPGYIVPRSARSLRVPDLEADEAAALELAVALVRLDGADGATGLWKVGAAGDPADAGARAPDEGGVAALPAHPQLGALFTAVAERRSVAFAYRDEQRTADPYRLDFARGRWYLLAFDHDRAAERWFRLDRMTGAPVVGPPDSFRPPATGVPGSVPDPWSLPVDEPFVARVAADAAVAPVVRSILGEGAVVEEQDDGGVVVELEVSHRDGFRSFVLGFLDHVEVLSPPDLRAHVVEWLDAVASGG